MKSFFLAARPKTLPAAIVPVWLGCALAWYLSGTLHVWLAFCTVMGALWIQIGTNLFNDAIDHDKGADTKDRLGPARVTSSGLLSRKAVYTSASVCLIVASLFGWYLTQARGWPIIAIGLPSLYLCYGYTGGPWPLAYKGLGELFVILFFGVIAVMGTVFIQLGEWHTAALLLGLQVGVLSSVLISINNLRDLTEDQSNEKRTLAVIMGEKQAKTMVLIELFFPAVISLFWLSWSIWLCLVPLIYLVLAIVIIKGVWKTSPSRIYNAYLALAALQLILFGAGFHIASIL